MFKVLENFVFDKMTENSIIVPIPKRQTGRRIRFLSNTKRSSEGRRNQKVPTSLLSYN
jgi:hypothetical protein